MSYPTGQGPSNPPAAGAPLTAEQDRQWASLAHLGGILFFPPALIIWLVFKDRGPFTNTEGKEALNFQITVALAMVACFFLMLLIIGFALIGLVGIGALVLTIIAGIKANDGVP